jgi:hypothetical protein
LVLAVFPPACFQALRPPLIAAAFGYPFSISFCAAPALVPSACQVQ